MSAYLLDARNLICPLPVIRTQEKIATLRSDDELLVVATDPGAMYDIPAWCRIHGHQVVDTDQSETEYRVKIRICR